MADPTGVALSQELAERSMGRDPEWSLQAIAPQLAAEFGGVPASLSDGVSVQKAIVTMWWIRLRELIAVYGSRVTITTLDLTATYTVTIDGNAVLYDAAAAAASTEADVIQGIVDAINTDVVVNLLVTCTSEARDKTTLDTIVVRNKGGELVTHTTAVGATGTGVMDFNEDAITADARFFLYPDNDNDVITVDWVYVGSADVSLSYIGLIDRFETSGSKRMFVELSSVTSATPGAKVQAFVAIGPCGKET